MAKIDVQLQAVVDRWEMMWRKRYGKEPPKVEGHAKRVIREAVNRVGLDDMLAAVDGYFLDDWPMNVAHEPGLMAKHVDKYAVKAKGGPDGTQSSGIVKTGDAGHEAKCDRWRKKWADQV